MLLGNLKVAQVHGTKVYLKLLILVLADEFALKGLVVAFSLCLLLLY